MSKLYVPILKWKAGERIAIRNLSDEIKLKLRPAIMVMPNTDYDTFVNEIFKEWGEDKPFYVDFHPQFDSVNDPTEFLEGLISLGTDLPFIPVISRHRNDEFFNIIEEEKDALKSGIAIKLGIQDFDNAESIIIETIEKVNFNFEEIDLLVDSGQIALPLEVIKTLSDVISSVLDKVKKFNFRRIIVAGSSFPETLNVKQGEITPLPRKEWILFREIIQKHSYIDFGDYGSDDPKDPIIETGIIIIPTVRYTHSDCWYIFRGIYNRKAPYDYTQFHTLAKQLLGEKFYSGKDFSWGDSKIFEIANTECSITKCNHGNLPTWVKISVNHHLTYVANQLSSLSSS